MTDYLYTSGGFPASPSSGDSLVINGLFYDWTGTAWKVRSIVTNRVETSQQPMVHQLRLLPHLI